MTGQPYTPPEEVPVTMGADEYRPDVVDGRVRRIGTPLHDAGAADGAPETDDE